MSGRLGHIAYNKGVGFPLQERQLALQGLLGLHKEILDRFLLRYTHGEAICAGKKGNFEIGGRYRLRYVYMYMENFQLSFLSCFSVFLPVGFPLVIISFSDGFPPPCCHGYHLQ